MTPAHLDFTPAQAEQIMLQAGELALQRARHAYALGVVDPMTLQAGLLAESPSADLIDYMIRSDEGLGWGGRSEYRYNGDDFEWCGAFVAYCMPWIDPELRQVYWSSTDRLNAYAQHKLLFGSAREKRLAAKYPKFTRRSWEAKGHEWTSAYARQFVTFDEQSVTGPPEARAGDIALVGPAFRQTGFRAHGDHVVLVDKPSEVSARWALDTYEGNAYGEIPGRPETKARPVQGVIRGVRPVGLRKADRRSVYHLRRWIRPSFFDVDLALYVRHGGVLPEVASPLLTE